jgi:hypothetical protein
MNAPVQYGQQPQPQYQGQQPNGGYPQGGPPPQQQPQGAPLGSPVQQAGEDASGFFTGGSGSPGLGFPQGEFQVWKGGIFTGQISRKQTTDIKTRKPVFWQGSGNPMEDVIVELLTDMRDGNNPLDDGRRRLFVTQKETNIPDSMASVVKEATSGGFHRGGQLWICKTGQRKGEFNMRSTWAAQYYPPTAETLALLDALPPQGVSQQGADQVQQGQQPQGPFVNGGQPNQGPPPQQGPPVNQGQQQPPQYQGLPAGTPAGQVPSYAGAPAASNHPQWGPAVAQQGYQPPQNGGYPQQGPPQYQQQRPPTGPAPQYQGPSPHQGQQPNGGYPQGGPPPQQGNPYQPPTQGAPAQTPNPYQPQQGYPQQ